jgi:hypothetical protein
MSGKPFAGFMVISVAMCALTYKLYADGSPAKFVWLTGVIGGLAVLGVLREILTRSRGDGL